MAFTESVDRYTMKEYFDNFYRNMEYKPITQDEFLEKHPMFKGIIKHSINRWTNKTFFIQNKDKDGIVRETLHLFSNKRHYTIIVQKDEYIGGGMTNRYQYVFEKQHRGCDLSDGRYTIETLCDIMADIVSYELIAVDIKPSVFEEEIVKEEDLMLNLSKEETKSHNNMLKRLIDEMNPNVEINVKRKQVTPSGPQAQRVYRQRYDDSIV